MSVTTKLLKIFAAAAVILLSVSVARADSTGDGRVGVTPAPPGDPPPACGSNQFTASGSGVLSASCLVTGSAVTSITIAVPQSESSQTGVPLGLSVVATLLTELGWTVPSSACPAGTVGGVAVYECTLTAPVSAQADPLNDSDCDSDDFEFGIPVGCSIGFTTETNLLANNAVVDVSTNGDPLAPITPEPGTLLLVSIGALAMLPSFVRRIRRPV